MDLMAGVESAALVEGIKFLYEQAGEILKAWRERRRDSQAPPPGAIEPPVGVQVERVDPLPDPTDQAMVDTLQELKDLVEPIKNGQVNPDAAAAREAVARLRDLLEVIVCSPITFSGEPARAVEISVVEVVVERVSGQVLAVRANLGKLPGLAIRKVRVETGDVEAGAEVTGIDLP